MNKEEQLLSLIHKRLTTELGETENQELNALLDDADNRLIAEEVENIWKNTNDYKKSFQPNVDAGLSKFKARIQTAQKTEAKVVGLGRRRWVTQVAAAAILLVGSWFVWNTFQTPIEEIVTIENTEEVHLSDNTEIKVNRGSSITYPSTFASNERRVELEGEAFFDVAKNPEKPFIIQTGKFQVKVLGTSFNIRNYADEYLTEITVRSGKVEVSNGSKTWTLEANQQLRFDKKEKKVSSKKDVQLNALAWFNGKLSFENEKMKKVKEALEHVYQIDLEFTEKSILDCNHTTNGVLNNESLVDILEGLKVQYGMKSIEKVNKGKYRLHGGNCNFD